MRFNRARTFVWSLVRACNLRDVIDDVNVVIDGLVGHRFVALVA